MVFDVANLWLKSIFIKTYVKYKYILGIIGVVWCAAWWVLVYDSPTQHPRISPDEKEYILKAIGDKVLSSRQNKVHSIFLI